ncbi:GNAT family N-acetyltransferase [Parasedimentitalea huanghaiensis]|uniref:GNAT family N-acetyltransferase n=1 Tax=Parasedimentitalea huanghaiensis TaxID=2682100 RepID=A0A6L6WEE6_9RHOB|nr:GNAT family N-acetyltransferase [Zongyanglinia huanghaiensis]MVO15810.1 GNAT family N-acetyltransferase [Zongyanglinia huanghaiensis]
MSVSTRTYHRGDAETLFEIFVEAIHDGASAHYTDAQLHAWAPSQDMPDSWPYTMAKLETWVAEAKGEIAGFMCATPQGYIDLAYVRPCWMGRSVAQTLYDVILKRARNTDLTRMTTHASLMARPFFARQGWQVDEMEIVDRNGEQLKRFAMSLTLGAPHDTTL